MTQSWSQRVHLPAPGDCPALTVVLGPCRSGTTALLRSAAAAGNRSYFQPLKRLARNAFVGQDAHFTLAPGTGPAVLKETFGPFVMEEVAFDPVSILLACGYPPHRLSVIVTIRHPADLFVSWQKLYGINTAFGGLDIDVFVEAFRQSLLVHRRASEADFTVSAFTPDGLSGRDPAEVISKLFSRHGLAFTSGSVEWDAATGKALDSLLVREQEPDLFRVRGALDGVRHSAGYRFEAARAGEPIDLPIRVRELVPEYETFLTRSMVDSGGAG